MTCIVGVISKKKVYIGGDSAGVAGLNVTVRKDPKVFKVKDFVIGCTTSFRMINLLKYSFSPPKRNPEVDMYEYMCTDFINTLRACFKNGGFTEIDKAVETGGTFLVGYQGRLFKIESDFQVGESMDEFEAIGCGESFALGALCALSPTMTAEAKIKRALEIAALRSGGVRPPFLIKST